MKEPTVFIIDYNDGLKAAAFLMTGMVEDLRSLSTWRAESTRSRH